jgi:membrane fusion protein (multidrug efflux system)
MVKNIMTSIKQLSKTKKIKKMIVTGSITIVILSAFMMWVYSEFFANTDNAYVNANIVQIAPRITGQVTTLFVTNNDYVKQNQSIFNIDPSTYQVALLKAEAQVAINEAQFLNAQLSADRKLALAKSKYISPQENDNAVATLHTSDAGRKQAHAILQEATLNLQWTKVIAPTSGWITNMTLDKGDMVSANQPLFALISDKEFWVDANFKETQLANIHPGQKAIVRVDMYPGHEFNGMVQSISGGTGSAFSLLPPQNATGNWVKITQRVPVRVVILNPDPKFPLRIGSSASVRISLHSYVLKH